MTQLADHVTFGEWWKCSSDSLPLGSLAVRRLNALTATTANAEILTFEPHGDPLRDRVAAFDPDGLEFLLDSLREDFSLGARQSGRNMRALQLRLAERWRFNRETVPFACIRVLRALGEQMEEPYRSVLARVQVEIAPDAVASQVDLAMFPPLPPGVPPRVWVSRSLGTMLDRNVWARARLVVAMAHEAAGHCLQHRVAVIGHTEGLRLDRELMEGWAIAAERLAAELGSDERALVALYRVKRLLPLYQTLPMWKELRSFVDRVWPGFFTTSDTDLLRRSLGDHSRGLARIETHFEGEVPHGAWLRHTPWVDSRA